jgi:hypothetical protein
MEFRAAYALFGAGFWTHLPHANLNQFQEERGCSANTAQTMRQRVRADTAGHPRRLLTRRKLLLAQGLMALPLFQIALPHSSRASDIGPVGQFSVFGRD